MTNLERLIFAFKLVASLGCGLMAGVFFAFSVFVMSALAQLQPPQGIAAMQSINIRVINPVFMLVFMGTALLCLILGGCALWKPLEFSSVWLLGGCLLYLVGTFGVTIAFNVPLNDVLAKVKPGSAEGARVWATYLVSWTLWNHVRTLAALAATACFILSLCQRAVR